MNTETKSEPSEFQKSIERTKVALRNAELFLVKHESKLPEGLGDLHLGSYGARFDVHLTHRNDDQRNRALSAIGEIFGRGGWKATLGYGGTSFDWAKEEEGVMINIQGAQPTGQPKSFPVDPKQFPIQIEDAA